MGAAETLSPLQMSEEDYLLMDREAFEKSELIEGEVIAMAGASFKHALMNTNLFAEIKNALRGKSCNVYSNDLRVRAGKSYLYPDATIVCGKANAQDGKADILLNPQIVFEILSPSTERKDRGIKSLLYRELETLQEYVLIGQDDIIVEHFFRQSDGIWAVRTLRQGSTLKLKSCEMELMIDALYDGLSAQE